MTSVTVKSFFRAAVGLISLQILVACQYLPFIREAESARRLTLQQLLGDLADSVNTSNSRFVIDQSSRLNDEVRRLLPDDYPQMLNARGLAYFYIGENDSAETVFDLALSHLPDNAWLLNNKGHMRLLKGDFDAATRYFSESLKADPTYETARINLEISQKFASGELSWSELEIKSIADTTSDQEEKARLYRQLVNLAPWYVDIYNNLAVAEFKLGNLNDAFRYLNLAVTLDPTYAMAHNNLGYLYHEYGLYDKAISHYLIAIRHQFNFFTAMENLAHAYIANGQTDEALQVIDRVLEVSPGRAVAQTMKKELEAARAAIPVTGNERPSQ